ncbi:hemerythrin domain-containing protein [Actinacidiphila glaucinigra]|uniref:hemerythrin domain-containing protein n=2 Tax=Actinacidiphila glaucinigra TaxID=235986 RepID=UPI0033A29706
MGTGSTGSAPADTRMMGIVHGALRRDLERTRTVLTSEPHPQPRQGSAVGRHVVWLMEFLHTHHTGEDEGLWPLVRERDPATGPLLDSLDTDHRRITPAAVTVTDAARRYAETASDEARIRLLAALDSLTAVLVPHLEREVAEAMPVVSATLTQAEWHAWDQEYNVRSKSLTQLGMEGHWLLDGIDPEGHRIVVRLVPPVPRFVLLYGFARAYRRRRAEWWPARDRARNGTAR